MIPELRKYFNDTFTEEVFHAFTSEINSALKYPVDFNIAETPIFLSDELSLELQHAAHEIVSQLQTPEFTQQSSRAIPAGLASPNEDAHATFLQVDFAICKDEHGNLTPRLIELQGFPSLYTYQILYDTVLRRHFDIPESYHTYFGGYNTESYLELLRTIIVGNSDPKNVVLLEIEPERQKTRVDFAATETYLGVPSVCITKVIKRGKKLFYRKENEEIPIERIYNRVIYDELHRRQIQPAFSFTDELDVQWVGHPNWFFKISKFTLPFLKSKYVPRCYFLNEINEYPDHLENYVLKPLFSFAGLGVEIDITKERLDAITDRAGYLLQEKISYEPIIETPDEPAKCEVRMMFLWDDKPRIVNNLVRMSKGKMMGVDFNKGKRWVGSSGAFHRV